MSHDFLYKEYELCSEQLRFYDTRQWELFKFLFGLATSVAGAQFVILKFSTTATDNFYAAQGVLCSIVYLASLLLFFSMIQNRLYFVQVARQINSIRDFLLSKDAGEFPIENNRMYLDSKFSALKSHSIHTYQLWGAIVISSIFAGNFAYAVSMSWGFISQTIATMTAFGISLLFEKWLGWRHLKSKNDKTADEAINSTR